MKSTTHLCGIYKLLLVLLVVTFANESSRPICTVLVFHLFKKILKKAQNLYFERSTPHFQDTMKNTLRDQVRLGMSLENGQRLRTDGTQWPRHFQFVVLQIRTSRRFNPNF